MSQIVCLGTRQRRKSMTGIRQSAATQEQKDPTVPIPKEHKMHIYPGGLQFFVPSRAFLVHLKDGMVQKIIDI